MASPATLIAKIRFIPILPLVLPQQPSFVRNILRDHDTQITLCKKLVNTFTID
jgi:hypothetical protein